MADTAALRTRLRQLVGLFPVTPTGFVAGLASLVGFVGLGIWREDRILLVLGAAGLLLCALMGLFTVGAALVIGRRVRNTALPPVRMVAGTPAPTGFEVHIPWWLAFVDLRWTVEEPDVTAQLVARGRRIHERWTPIRRGTPDRVVRWFTVGDAFGLASVRFRVEKPLDARFLPDEGSLRRVEVIQGLASGDQIAHPEGRPEGDLQDMRRYGAGDPIRFVLWKVFARSRTLVVRTPERALSPITRTAAYLVTGPGDQAAAGTAKTAVSCGALGEEWVFGCDGTTATASTRQEAEPLIVASAAHPAADGGDGLRTFLDAADNPRRIVVFAPAVPGPWVDRVRALGSTVHVEIVLCADHVVPARPRFDLRQLVLVPAPPAPPAEVHPERAALGRLCKQLAGVGTIRIVERKSGAVYAGAHIDRLTRGAA